MAFGLLSGAIFGGAYGLITGLALGLILGLSFGAGIGFAVGLINGLLVGLLIRLWLGSQHRLEAHARVVTAIGSGLGLLGTLTLLTMLLTPPDQITAWPTNLERWMVFYAAIPMLIASVVGWKTNEAIVDWYLFEAD